MKAPDVNIKKHAGSVDGRVDDSVVHTGDQHVNGHKLAFIFNILAHDVWVTPMLQFCFEETRSHGLVEIFRKTGNFIGGSCCFFFVARGIFFLPFSLFSFINKRYNVSSFISLGPF